MVTEVQSKMYLPGYYSTKDISNGAGYGGWSLPHENGSLKNSQPHYGVFLSAPITNSVVNYENALEKEKLRRTIMEHDSIFRHQVHELHRLYRKQKDLMSEFQGKEHSNRFSWRASSFQSSQISAKVTTQNSSPLDLKSKRPQRILFDLEAPAENYIDDTEEIAEVARVQSQAQTGNGNTPRSDSYPPKRTHNLADLNEPIVEVDEELDLGSDRNVETEIVFSKEQRQSHVYTNMWSAAKQFSENRVIVKTEGVIGNFRSKNESVSDRIQAGNTKNNVEFHKPGESTRIETHQNTTLKSPVKQKIFGVEVSEGNNDTRFLASKAIINVSDSEPSSTLSCAKPESNSNNPIESACREILDPLKPRRQTALPWLHNKKSTLVNEKSQSPIHDSSSMTTENKRLESSTSECSSAKMILGFPIFSLAPQPNPVVKHHQIDLNECFEEEQKEEEEQDHRPPLRPEIDLEAPVSIETDSDNDGLEPSSSIAAEALITIARSRPIDNDSHLHLLADIIDDNNDDTNSEAEEMDEFEQIILNLAETEREDRIYSAPVIIEVDSPGEAQATRRPRRRGRQRTKDFQREVLPGMATLSRNEVTEDLQIMEGLVRATGGTWQSTLTARASVGGGGRGRRRSSNGGSAVVAIPSDVSCGFEAGIEETTSLAGWGKRTRRPPRQRCPISNSLLPLK